MAKSLIYGIHAIQTALEHDPHNIRNVWVDTSKQNKRLDTLIALAKKSGISIQTSKSKQLDRMANNTRHQGIVAEYNLQQSYHEDDLFNLIEKLQVQEQKPLILVLDGVTDPHNLGACMRTAEGAGAHAVVIPKDNSVGLTPTVRKVASGAAELIPLIPVTNIARTLDQLKQLGLWAVATSDKADATLFETDLDIPLVLIMGAEGKGIRPLTEKHSDILVKLPMMGQVSSLNVSVATGICLYEAVRQRLTPVN